MLDNIENKPAMDLLDLKARESLVTARFNRQERERGKQRVIASTLRSVFWVTAALAAAAGTYWYIQSGNIPTGNFVENLREGQGIFYVPVTMGPLAAACSLYKAIF